MTAVQKVPAGSTVMQIEKIESGGTVTYEVEYRRDGKDHETYFAVDGTIVRTLTTTLALIRSSKIVR